jgi:hypothetical protein
MIVILLVDYLVLPVVPIVTILPIILLLPTTRGTNTNRFPRLRCLSVSRKIRIAHICWIVLATAPPTFVSLAALHYAACILVWAVAVFLVDPEMAASLRKGRRGIGRGAAC